MGDCLPHLFDAANATNVPSGNNITTAGNNITTASNNITTAGNNITTAGNTVVLIDENVSRLHSKRLEPALKFLPVLALTATEENKSWSGVGKIVRFFMSNGCNRSTKAIVIGGGIVQDLSAFACHTFFRGIQWEFFPTTLLAMADSCIGAKSALNFEGTKNLVGVFENPRKVIIDTQFASTLSDRDLCSGFGEILKSALITGENSLTNLSHHWQLPPQKANLEPLIRDALTTKKRFVEEDEFDFGNRRMLNYGHTLGHALESVTNYAIPHGIAVVLGMDIENFVAMKLGLMKPESFLSIHEMIKKYFPIANELTKLTNVQIDAILPYIMKDKKRTANGVHFAIVTKPGEWDIPLIPLDDRTKNAVTLYFTSEYSIIKKICTAQ